MSSLLLATEGPFKLSALFVTIRRRFCINFSHYVLLMFVCFLYLTFVYTHDYSVIWVSAGDEKDLICVISSGFCLISSGVWFAMLFGEFFCSLFCAWLYHHRNKLKAAFWNIMEDLKLWVAFALLVIFMCLLVLSFWQCLCRNSIYAINISWSCFRLLSYEFCFKLSDCYWLVAFIHVG